MRRITELELMKEFGDNLKDIMDDYQMTQKELADITGISVSAISRYIHGQRMPTLKTLINIVNALECDVDELVNFDYFVE